MFSRKGFFFSSQVSFLYEHRSEGKEGASGGQLMWALLPA